MSGDSWENVQVSGVTSEMPVAKDFKLLEYCLGKGCTVEFDIRITMTRRDEIGMARSEDDKQVVPREI